MVHDLYQEIMLEIWKGLPGFEGRARLDTWIYRVALNTAISFKEKAARRIHTVDGVSEQESPYMRISATGQGESQILQEFIRSLDETDRLLFLMYLDDDFSYADMSEVTGLNEPHIRVKISRIKKAYVKSYIER